MAIFLQQLLNGVTIAGCYILVSVGFALIFGVLRVVYFAHGAVMTAGAYVGIFALQYSNSVPVALFAGIIGAALLGVIVERVSVRPVRGENHLIALVTTVSAATIIQELLRLSVSRGQPISYPENGLSGLVRVPVSSGEVYVTYVQLTIILVSILLVIGTTILIQRTWMGLTIRSVADSAPVSELLGVDIVKVSAQTIAMSSALAGAAGVLLGLTVPAIDPFMGEPLQFKALAIALFGGLGSLPGAVLGGAILGIVEAFAAGYLESSYRDLFAYMTMILILVARPSGLLGKNIVQRV
jgi:branched-chain amino acid transport system permease protein